MPARFFQRKRNLRFSKPFLKQNRYDVRPRGALPFLDPLAYINAPAVLHSLYSRVGMQQFWNITVIVLKMDRSDMIYPLMQMSAILSAVLVIQLALDSNRLRNDLKNSISNLQIW